MKFTANKSELLTALGRCLSVTHAKSTLPILGSVYLSVGKTLLTIGATDLFRAITVKLEVDIGESGTICLPAQELFERVRSLQEGKVAFVAEGTKATLKTAGTSRRFTMHGAPGEDFPLLPIANGTDAKLEITTFKLAQIMGAVHHAISTDSSRPHMMAMLLESDSKGIRAATMDSNKMCSMLQGEEPHGPQWLIPLAAINDLRKLCDTKEDEPLTLQQDGPVLFARFDDFIFSTKLMNWEFPAWQEHLPKLARTVTINRAGLIDSLRAVAVSSSDRTRCVRFNFRKGALCLQAQDATEGEGFDEIETDYDGDSIEIGFNHKLVADALAVLATENITFSTGTPNDPGIIRVPGSDAYLAVIAAMKV